MARKLDSEFRFWIILARKFNSLLHFKINFEREIRKCLNFWLWRENSNITFLFWGEFTKIVFWRKFFVQWPCQIFRCLSFNLFLIFFYTLTAHILLFLFTLQRNSMTSWFLFFRSKNQAQFEYGGQIGNQFWNGVDEHFHGNGNFVCSLSNSGKYLTIFRTFWFFNFCDFFTFWFL